MRGVIAYAPHVPDCDLPWLFEYDPVDGAVTALVAVGDAGPVGARRDQSRHRAHTSLHTACAAYGLDPARDVALRWWRDVDLARVAEVELWRRGLAGGRVERDGTFVWVVAAGTRMRVATPHDLLRWNTPAQAA